jgi:hypothetical protein
VVKFLIINAHDYGCGHGINRGIIGLENLDQACPLGPLELGGVELPEVVALLQAFRKLEGSLAESLAIRHR